MERAVSLGAADERRISAFEEAARSRTPALGTQSG